MRTVASGGMLAVVLAAGILLSPAAPVDLQDVVVRGVEGVVAAPQDPRPNPAYRENAVTAREQVDEPFFLLMKRNRSRLHQKYGTPVYRVRTNGEGLREEPFTTTPPPNTTRILVLGDSFTYGMGVNVSDRYADIMEERLNASLSSEVEVIVAAVPGWGVKDYYTFLRERGREYRPDFVVIGLVRDDGLSIRETQRLVQRTKTELGLGSAQEMSGQETKHLQRRVGEKLNERRGQPVNRTGFRYLQNISAYTGEAPFLVYVVSFLTAEQRQFLARWNRTTDSGHLLYSPTELRDVRGQALRESEYRLSRYDTHPSVAGHRLLGERLSGWLLSNRELLDRDSR